MTAAVTSEIVVYRARNTANGKCYIGVTKQGLRRREGGHRAQAKRGSGFVFHQALRKYGERIVFEQVATFEDYDLALVYEQEAIAKWKPEYNVSLGGEGRTGPMSEEHKQKLRIANRGQGLGRKGPPLSEEHKRRLREANLGNRHALGAVRSEAERQAVSRARKGHVSPFRGIARSPETVEKIRAANTGKKYPSRAKASAATLQKMRDVRLGVPLEMTPARQAALAVSIRKASTARKIPVVCLTDGRTFTSAIEAGAFYGVKPAIVRQSIQRGQTLRSGIQFRDISDDD